MATEFSQVAIGGADRSASTLRVDLWRTINSVGEWSALLRNTDGVFNGVFDVQDQFLIDVNGIANTLMQGRVDMDAVKLTGEDNQSDWDEYITIRGVDQAQDLLFHNDFEQFYPDITQQFKAVWNDVINVQLTTNITYAPPVGATPVVGAVEWREGSSFLTTLQEMSRTAGYIWYVDDSLAFQSGAPGFSASGVILRSEAGDNTSNIINAVDLTERNGSKLFNDIKLYGKNPMFDGYTELNHTGVAATGWTANAGAGGIQDDTGTVRVGTYSGLVFNTNAGARTVCRHVLTLPVFNYIAALGQWDFSKGTIGAWGNYDNTAGAPGTPQAGVAPATEMAEIRLIDSAGAIASYYGESTRLYIGEWGFMNATLGQKYDNTGVVAADQWSFVGGPGTFLWDDVRVIWFQFPRSNLAANQPAHFYIDGITIPIATIGAASNAASIAAYRNRPYVDNWTHLRTQNAIQEAADTFLAHHKDTGIDKVSIVTEGNLALRYAGQTVTVDIPSMGLTDTVMYMTKIHHIIQPYSDISGGYGFDWITEVEAVPTSGVEYDMDRLKDTGVRSADRVATRAGVGLRIK